MFKRRDRNDEESERYRPSDILAMIVASMQILLPFVVAIIIAAGAAYLFFVFLFH